MSMTLSGGTIFAETSIRAGNHPSAQRGIGSYILGITLDININSFKETRILQNFTASLYLDSKFIAPHTPIDGDIRARSLPQNHYRTNYRLNFVLSKETMRSIEKIRGNDDLHFTIKLNGAVTSNVENEPTYVFDEINHTIHQSQWVSLLRNWNYCQSFLLEISFDENSNNLLKSAHNFFKKAQDQFLFGNWDSSISECRKVLDSILEQTGIDQKGINKILDSRRANSLHDRLKLAVFSVKQVCDPASHGDENAVSIDWRREDAEMILFQTASLLKRFSEGSS